MGALDPRFHHSPGSVWVYSCGNGECGGKILIRKENRERVEGTRQE